MDHRPERVGRSWRREWPIAAHDAAEVDAFALRWVLMMNGIAEQVRLEVPGHAARWARHYVLAGMASDLGR
ncbi:MAG: hypothetical protein LH645_14305 [Actinomycetia bacterium]|nr:hypothetical protein [Actinomycetes bacterium]